MPKKIIMIHICKSKYHNTFKHPYCFVREIDTIVGLLCMAGQAGSRGDGKAGRSVASWQGPIPMVPKQDEQSRSSGSPLTAGHVCRDKAGLRSSQKVRLARKGENQESTRAGPAHLQHSSGEDQEQGPDPEHSS